MWFAHVVGPLGAYIRTRWMFVIDVGVCREENEDLLRQEQVSRLSKDVLEELMLVSSIDPDLVDVMLSSSADCAYVVRYGR
jgi:hypothetical protein